MLQDPLQTLLQFLYLLSQVVLIAGVGFAAGYLYARGRKPKRDTSGATEDTQELDTEITHLKTEVDRAEEAVDQLWKKARITVQPSVGNRAIQQASYRGPRRQGKFKKWLDDFFGRGEKEDEASPHPLGRKVKGVKIQVIDIRKKIHNVTPFLTAGETNKDRREAQPDKDLHNMRDAVDDDHQDDTLPGVKPVRQDAQADEPTIIRQPREDTPHQSHGGSGGGPAAGGRSLPVIGSNIIELYNRAVTDTFARDEFRERVQPARVGTVNAVERSQNPNIPAEFKETSDGDLLAFAISGSSLYAVVPRLGLTIEAIRYTAGALGVVFAKTQGYDAQCFYSRYRVRQPAYFKCDGDRWELLEPGKLELGSGD